MKYFLVGIACCLFNSSIAQNKIDDKDAITAVINSVFDAIRKGDTSQLMEGFTDSSYILSVNKKAGIVSLYNEPVQNFTAEIQKAKRGSLDERINIEKILIDTELAVVWAPYKFYVKNVFAHCGVNVIHLVKFHETWKIVSIYDTRHLRDCK